MYLTAYILYEVEKKRNHSGGEVERRQMVRFDFLQRVRVVVHLLAAGTYLSQPFHHVLSRFA